MAIMRKLSVVLGVISVSISFISSWAQVPVTHRDARVFTKRIENNYSGGPRRITAAGDTVRYYNTKNKTDLEKLFFGKINADVEFLYVTSARVGTQGLRVFKETYREPYVIEAIRVTNQREVDSTLMKNMQNKMGPSIQLGWRRGGSKEEREQASVKISEGLEEIKRERAKRYSLERKSVVISDSLAKKLQGEVMPVIDKYRCYGSPMGVFDGYIVTFGCTAGYEAWSLTVQAPAGDAERMTEIFLIIVKDIFAGKFDESNCLKTLENYKVAESPREGQGVTRVNSLEELLRGRSQSVQRTD